MLTSNTYFVDQEKKHFVGARLASGQDILCKQLIIDPTLDAPFDDPGSKFPRKVARGICIFSNSLKQGSSNVLVVFPPKCKNKYYFILVFMLGFLDVAMGSVISLS